MANLFQPSINRVMNSVGNVAPGAKLYFYLTGTTTAATYYLDQAGTTAGSQPLVANAAGVFLQPAYLDPDTTYRIKLTNAPGTETIFDVDPVRGYDAGMIQTAAEEAVAARDQAVAAAAQAVPAAAQAIAAAADAESAKDDAETAAGQAIAAAATPALLIQTNPATPTVPPAGSSSGGYYWAVDAGGENLILYLNTAGTGAPVSPAVSVPQSILVEQVTSVLPGINSVLNPDVVEKRMGVLSLTAGAATFPDAYSWLVYQATERGPITEIGLRVGAVGSGAVSLAIYTGDPESGSMTFVRSVALATVVSTGDNVWTNPDPEFVEVGQWVGYIFPSGGVQPRRRDSGRAKAYFRTPPLTAGSGVFASSIGLSLETYFKYETTEYSIDLTSLSTDVRGTLSSVGAGSNTETVWTGYGGSMTIVDGALGTNTMIYMGTAAYAGPMTGLQFRVPTLNSGVTHLMIVRGALSGRPVIVTDVLLPTIMSAGAVSFTSADFGDVVLEAGDHVYVMSEVGGPTMGLGSVASAVPFYFGSSGNGTPYAGCVLELLMSTGLTGQGRFSQSVSNLHLLPQTTPTMWDIFLTAGQSNMVGLADGGGPFILSGVAKQYYSGSLTEITGDPVGGATYGSMLPSFANEYYRRTGRGVIFVPAGLIGSPLLQATLGGTDNWSGTGTLRGTAIALLNSAKSAATSASLAWQFAGVLWCQGERDADGIDAGTPGVTAAAYITEFGNLKSYFEAQTGNASGNMPIMLFRTGMKSTGDTTGYQQIRDAQDTICRTYSGTHMAHTGAFNFRARGLMKDLYHYEQPAYNEMGVSGAMVAASRSVGST